MDGESVVRSMMHLSVTLDHSALYEEPVAEMIRTLTANWQDLAAYLTTTSSRAPYDNSGAVSSDGDAITT